MNGLSPLLLQEAMLTHEVAARPNRVVARVFRVGLMKKLGLSCSGARHRTFSGASSGAAAEPDTLAGSSAREQKVKNVASTMGFGCGR